MSYLQRERNRLGQVCKLVIRYNKSQLMLTQSLQEVRQLQRQLQDTSDKEERRKLADTLSLTEAKRELEHSKWVR